MAKKPDFSDLTKKFDFNSLVGGIKSLLNPESDIPEVDPSDAIGVKIAQLSMMMAQMAKMQEQQAKDFAIASQLLNDLYKDLEALRHPPTPPGSPEQAPSSPSAPDQADDEKKL